jgi:phosphoglycerate kinase
MGAFRTLDRADVAGKRVLVRVDFNVPIEHGRVSDYARLVAAHPTVRDIVTRNGKAILLSHFGRPKGRDPSQSLAPVAPEFAKILGRPVAFVPDCIGAQAEEAVAAMKPGDVLLLENTRFYPGEEKNAPDFVAALAKLGDLYVNDAFSVSHRAHASTEGIARKLPAYAGYSMQAELAALEKAFEAPERPFAAVVGGAKVSTKLEMLESLVARVDALAIGGAMANTFLLAQGKNVGKSLVERDLVGTATKVLAAAKAKSCAIVLPVDAVVAEKFEKGAPSRTLAVDAVGPADLILDVGPRTIAAIADVLARMRTVVWNGPLGAFETSPFDSGTVAVARLIADLTARGLHSFAGGGDTLAALNHAGVAGQLSYVSTAGGAFLEWLEGKPLPGVEALRIK